jgi:biopolymer transport protein ExbD
MKTVVEQMELGGDQPDLTPMIDCVFLLLLFFVVTAVFAEEARLFEVQLPMAEQSEVRQLSEAMVLSISPEGDLSIGEKLVAEDQLWSVMKSIHDASPVDTLIIKGDRRAPYEQVVRAHDVGRAVGIGSVVFAVDAR